MIPNKLKLISAVLVLVVALPLMAAPPQNARPPRPAASTYLSTQDFVNINSLLMFATNYGNYAYDAGKFFGKNDGLYFPYSTLADIRSGLNDKTVLFDAGIWMGAIDSASDSTLVTVAEYSTEYGPGPMQGGTFIPGSDLNPIYRNYYLKSDSMAGNPGADYSDWPVSQGAPVDSLGHPIITGDEMIWSVYNDANPANHSNQAAATSPMGVEIQQSTFAFRLSGPFANIAFLRFKIMNKGVRVLKDAYVALWSDPDLGGSSDDLVGCDTTLSLGYCYNGTNNDAVYGSTPPSVGFDFFQGPLEPSPDSTAKMWGKTYPGFRNLPMSSFPKYINGKDPKGAIQSYNLFQGLQTDGTPFTYLGNPTKFSASGDPTTGTGDLDNSPADRRMLLNTGPFTLRPGDSTEIIAAVLVGQGKDRLTSISALKYYDRFAQNAYNLDFNLPKPPAAPEVKIANLENKVVLSWTDKSEVQNGDYPFQGYTVYQALSPNGPWKQLANYDINDGVGIIFDDQFDVNTGVIINEPVKFGSDNGVKRYFISTRDEFTGTTLSNITQYFYKVEAYSYSAPQTPKTLTSETISVTTPQKPIAGLHLTSAPGDSLPSSAILHRGTSDGAVKVYVVDPTRTNGHNYKIEFYDDTLGVTVWRFIDMTTLDTIVAHGTNLTGDNDYPVVDGIMAKVTGPPLVGKSTAYTSASPLNISPIAAATDPAYQGGRWFTGDPANGGELQNGMVFMEPNFWGETSVTPAEYPIVEIKWRPMKSYTDLNGNGFFDVGEPYEVDDTVKTQWAFTYQGFSGATFLGMARVPFTAWDITNPASPRQLNVVFRDRDQNHQWDINSQVTDPLLPNGGDLRFNYLWITTTTYDSTFTIYDPNKVGGKDFFGFDGGNGIWDAAWMLWAYDRGVVVDSNGVSRSTLAEEANYVLTPNFVNTPADTFLFTSPAPGSLTKNAASLADIRAVPNPYYLFSKYDSDIFRRQIRFTNLPQQCTISIYNLAGDKIAKVDKNSTDSWTSWNIQTSNGIPVASGIYIYVVDAPGYGQKVGKLAVFTEVEQLKTY